MVVTFRHISHVHVNIMIYFLLCNACLNGLGLNFLYKLVTTSFQITNKIMKLFMALTICPDKHLRPKRLGYQHFDAMMKLYQSVYKKDTVSLIKVTFHYIHCTYPWCQIWRRPHCTWSMAVRPVGRLGWRLGLRKLRSTSGGWTFPVVSSWRTGTNR